MKALINLIVFLSLVSFTIISCTKDDKNIEITDTAINLDTSKYAFYNNVELDLSFIYTSPIVHDFIINYDTAGNAIDTIELIYRVNFDLTDKQFRQSQINTTDLYTRQVTFNGSIIADDVLFVDDGTHLIPNYMYITQEPATNIISIYSHYQTSSFQFDLYLYNAGTSQTGETHRYTDQVPLPPPEPRMASVNFHNVDNPLTSTIDYNNDENTFILYGQILYAGQQTSNCQISENYDTIEGDFSGMVQITYKLHYIDTFLPYSKVWNITQYVDIENGELLMTKID